MKQSAIRTIRTFLIPILVLPGISGLSQTYKNSLPERAMVFIPAGEYIIGKDSPRETDFSPAHSVKLNAFYMDTYEVTNAEYLAFCQETGYKLPEFWNTPVFNSGENFLNYPVVGINWFDAMKYAQWAGKRLPTEAEWEVAARGGLTNNEYPNGNEWNKPRAKQDSTGWKNLIEPVGNYEPNGYGLFDMGGNAWEWVLDVYDDSYYKERTYDNPTGPQAGPFKVIRGGSWHSGAMCKRVYYRKGLGANWCDFAVGFRCAKDAE